MEITTQFINLQTDFGFKRVFGDPRHKHILIRFLNALLGEKINIKDVIYKNKEIIPPNPDGKRIVYDVYCTSSVSGMESDFLYGSLFEKEKDSPRDHHFILEMQNIYTPPFEERMVYYTSRMVADQGVSGWNYNLEPVITVAVTDFNFRNRSEKMTRDVMLLDRETGEVLTEKLHIIFVSLKKVPEEWIKCETDLERILFLIKNMDKMDTNSIAYKEGGYRDMFNAARTTSLKDEDVIRYSESLYKLRETQEGIKYEAWMASKEARAKALAEGRAEGLALGHAEGRAEGRAEGEKREKLRSAQIMLGMGLPKETILAITSLSEKDLEDLKR